MYSLFEVRKILAVSNPGGGKDVEIILTAYTENKESSSLALVCSNGYILFRYVCNKWDSPLMRQLCWFNNPGKVIKALCFDPSGLWLLIVTQDASLYILPAFSFFNPDTKISANWKVDNLTEIKLPGKRASFTSVQWWQTHAGEHIAIIGSELGEISFVNLVNKKEVGGTYITIGISALDILYDESHDTTYLLITGYSQQQWRLLLEEKKSNFYWPFSSDSDVSNIKKGMPVAERILLADEKNGDQRPHRLSKFESGTFLTPQGGDGRNLVSAYSSSSCLLQVLEGDLDQMHLFSYKVPAECESIVLSDKFIFATLRDQTVSNQRVFKIISRKFSEISSENAKKKESQCAEIQSFVFSDKIIALYKLLNHSSRKKRVSFSAQGNSSENPDNLEISESASNFNVVNKSFNNLGTSQSMHTSDIKTRTLEGCILIQKDCVWECRQKISAKELFLSLTDTPTTLPLAENVCMMLGLDLHKLYEIAADKQLSNGRFPQAVHLYQLSKCPQLKRVAHFMGYGFLSELIAYIQVLFSTKGVEIVSADKCHFANIALHCFAHQAKNKLTERMMINTAFKKFLKENLYYDEEVSAKLLAEQGLYELIHFFAKVRGQQGLAVETLLVTDGIKNTIDAHILDILRNSPYEVILHHENAEHYMKCMTSYHLLQFLAAKPSFLNLHLKHLILLLPAMDIPSLRRVAYLFDPSRQVARLSFKNMSSTISKRSWSLSSLATISCDMNDPKLKEEASTIEDIIKFFVFVLLMLCYKLGYPKFLKDLLKNEVFCVEPSNFETSSENIKELIDSKKTLSCGQAHTAYIHNGILYMWGKSGSGRLGIEDIDEYLPPQPVPILLQLQVNVLSVSCGALHTLALTDYGLFSWGSSRFGQLGVGEVQQSVQPLIIESLLAEKIQQVCCGQYHSMALTCSGRVYTWGWGVHGQLGHGNAEDQNIPKLIECIKKRRIISICAGQGHSVLLSKNEEVYTFGCGMFGQLGTGTVLKQSRPVEINIPEQIRLIASGFFHVIAVSNTNKIYTWGCNPQSLRIQAQNSRRARQHGTNTSLNSRLSPGSTNGSSLHQRSSNVNNAVQQSHLLPNLLNTSLINDDITEVSCGSHHTVVVTNSGEVYSWGRNSEGQIGNGTRKEQKIPSLVIGLKDRQIEHISCGADFSIAVDMNAKIFGWGQNDSGQLGLKPVLESNTKHNSGSSGGRVITIRTNRRMITITQPCRQSVLRPIEVAVPYYEIKSSIYDSGSFENEYSVVKILNHDLQSRNLGENIPQLSSLDDPPYGPRALHAALNIFHQYFDFTMLLNHCLNFGNFQAAAKLCALEKLFDQALDYQLKALSVESNPVQSQMALFITEYYTNLLEIRNEDTNQKFLNNIIRFWIQNNLEILPLEKFFQAYNCIFSYPLSIILSSNDASIVTEFEVQQKFISQLSPKFCMDILYGTIKEMQQGSHLRNLVDEMVTLSNTKNTLHKIQDSDTLTEWDDSIPQERLWMDIMHNLQAGIAPHSAIHMSTNNIDFLAKSLISEKFYSQSFNNASEITELNFDRNDVAIFSCGHYYTLASFHSNILQLFKESMVALTYPLPLTIKLLLSEYQEDILTVACPKCVINEISNSL
ncbi:uncharacterized protein [Parasteatoda tepidariorum]|nr:uncharacterized protein LOC107446431 [Parasteatoda tepidariorum]XP_015916559.2 uncharacterized protein LOC107446431 [Parasteatoda tepidariorum]